MKPWITVTSQDEILFRRRSWRAFLQFARTLHFPATYILRVGLQRSCNEGEYSTKFTFWHAVQAFLEDYYAVDNIPEVAAVNRKFAREVLA